MIDWSMAKMNEIRIRTDTLVVHIVNHPHHYLICVETHKTTAASITKTKILQKRRSIIIIKIAYFYYFIHYSQIISLLPAFTRSELILL
jgi:hypothetical protein